MLRQLGKSPTCAGTNAEFSEEGADPAVVVTLFVSGVAVADSLRPSSGGLPLYHCLSQCLLVFVGSLWQNAKFAFLCAKRPVHCYSNWYLNQMQRVDKDCLRGERACACSVTIAPSRTKHPITELGVFSKRTIQKAGVAGTCKRRCYGVLCPRPVNPESRYRGECWLSRRAWAARDPRGEKWQSEAGRWKLPEVTRR